MIQITKGNEPPSLATKKATWTAQVLAHIAAGDKVPKNIENNYNTSEVKTALRNECRNKCMYCESSIGHITFEHIEHIKPKARTKFPELTFEYSNLGLACPKCNMNKSDTYDAATPFINPYTDNPAIHFTAYGAWVWANAGNNRAKVTELEIDLNRPELIEKRGERIKAIKELVDNYNNAPEGVLKNALKKEIEKEIAEDKEYSFCTGQLTKTLMNNK